MITGGRTACQLGNALSSLDVHQLNKRLATHIQPGIKAGDWLVVLVNHPHTGHLRIKSKRGDLPWIYLRSNSTQVRTV